MPASSRSSWEATLPLADLAKQFLSQYLDLKQNTRAGYYSQIAMFMKWYGDPIDDCRVNPTDDMPELVDSRDLDKYHRRSLRHL